MRRQISLRPLPDGVAWAPAAINPRRFPSSAEAQERLIPTVSARPPDSKIVERGGC